MAQKIKTDPAIIVVFGASGDLAARKVMPAFYNLFLDDAMPADFKIVGVSRSPFSKESFCAHLRDGIEKFGRRGLGDEKTWEKFASKIHYISAAYDDENVYDTILGLTLKDVANPNFIFYLATPPSLFSVVTAQLGRFRKMRKDPRYRIVVEKPFGRDLESARSLNEELTHAFFETQIFRIDHYLGKETVQNILAFRFGNSLWEPLWNRRYIDHVQITVAEDIGIGDRGGYYETAGALRDMIQNHILQLLCLVAMEPPTSFDADEIRNKKCDVLRALHEIEPGKIADYVVRGQYGDGWSNGAPVRNYRHEKNVNPKSNTETYVALKLFIDNWRWQGVPFYLRTGKYMPSRVSEISLQFRPVPHHPFSHLNKQVFDPNRLVIQIAPTEGIVLRTLVKEPGLGMNLRPVDMNYCYNEVFHTPSPDAYETLLLDVLRNDPGLFMRADQVEVAWEVLQPVLENWEHEKNRSFPNYPAGQWGPPEADRLLAKNGHAWFLPICLEPDEK